MLEEQGFVRQRAPAYDKELYKREEKGHAINFWMNASCERAW